MPASQPAPNLVKKLIITSTYNILKDILVAIDLGSSTPFIIKQAIELSAGNDVTIHLLHVYQQELADTIGYVENVNDDDPNRSATIKKLKEWKACLQETIPGTKIKAYFLNGSVQQCILDVAENIKPQLIIIGKPGKAGYFRFYRPLNADRLSRLSKCPVLTIMNYDNHNKMKTIILPVRDFIPVRKMELLAVFARIYRARIHVVALQSKIFEHQKEWDVLLETYRVLRNGLNNKIEYLLLKGNNFPRAVADHAAAVGADMLIVNPKKETRISGIFRTDISDMLPKHSGLKVLSVVPYHDLQ
jgi:nucleotide-binding universal stress UspA family protein